VATADLKGSSVLVLEDEVFLRRDVAGFLEDRGAEVYEAKNLAEARNCLREVAFDFVLMDINLPDGNSLDLLREGAVSGNSIVVVMTAEGGVETAVDAMRLGAADYLSKPFETGELPIVFERARQGRSLSRIREHELEAAGGGGDAGFFFSEGLTALRAQLDRILDADARMRGAPPAILIEGETGTGKSSIARWIHQNGPRAAAPLIEVNCSTLPDQLAESELFGHEKGAFTDARSSRIGLFEAARGGTLFLDEVASLSPAVQTKLLTAIENRVIRRLGGNRPIAVDVRLIAASLRPVDDLVAEGLFREDLFHRLNLLRLRLPPLRERPGDIPALAERLLKPLKSRYRRPAVTISAAGMQRLCACAWPGNVRELAHELERALIFAESDTLDFAHLGGGASAASAADATASATGLLNPFWQLPAEDAGFDFEKALQELTGAVIQRALDACDGNVSAAARLLGVSRDFVRYRLKQGD